LTNRIKSGNHLEIGLKGGGERKKLTSTVEAVLNDKEVLIVMPTSAGSMIRLPIDEGFEARFYTGASVIVFDVTIADHPIVDGKYLTTLRIVSAGKRVPLREFVRVPCTISFNFTIPSELRAEDGTRTHYKGVTKDISGGGMNFISDLDIEGKTELLINFELNGEYIVVLARVLDRENVQGSPDKSQYRCQFMAMSDREQVKILQFTNNRQLKARGTD
jgi:c-di-GMP-binding flagellar brake protein YcgR